MDDIEQHRRTVRAFMSRRPFGKRDLTDREAATFCAALTHDSYTDEAKKLQPPRFVECYERLEFLGDAVVELLACEHVFLDTECMEGEMTDYKKMKDGEYDGNNYRNKEIHHRQRVTRCTNRLNTIIATQLRKDISP